MMFEIQNYYSFILAILLFQLFPGVGTIAILTATATHGIKSGMSAVLGTLVGDLLYMTSAVLGLATILNNFPTVLKVAQYTGVIYLFYLGLKKLFSKITGNSHDQVVKTSHLATFKQALVICLTNPKAILFFMAFFPLFLTQDSKSVTLVLMMIHVTIISLIVTVQVDS